MSKGNSHKKLCPRDDFALKYYCRRSREFEKSKMKMKTNNRNRTLAKHQVKHY